MADKKNNRNERPDFAELHRQAEAKLAERRKKTGPLPSMDTDIRRLVHELEVHQIELEMQNEELMQTWAEREAVLKQYTDLYDFAPIGYFTLARDGTIRMANLTGANLLGVERGKLIERRFGQFVTDEYRTAFIDFLERVFECNEKESFQVELRKEAGEACWVQIEAVWLDDEQECRATVVDISKRKKAETALGKSEEKYRLFFETIQDGAFVTTPEGELIDCSKSLVKLFGYDSKDEIIGKNIEAYYANIKRRKNITNEINSREDLTGGEREFVKKGGEIFPALVKYSVLRDEKENIARFQGIVINLSERKKAEQKNQESTERFRKVWEQSSEALVLSDAEGIVQAVNPAYITLYGYSAEQLLGQSFAIIFPEEYRESAVEQYKAVFASDDLPDSFEAVIRRSDGSERIVDSRATFLMDNGQRTAMLSSIRDISERKKAENEITKQKKIAENYLHIVGNIIIALNREGKITLLNKKGYEILGYEEGELDGKDWFSTCLPKEVAHEVKEYFIKVIDGKVDSPKIYENEIVKKDGQKRIIRWFNTLVKDDFGNIIGLLSSGEDITERKKAEEQIRFQANLLEAVGQAVIATDLNGIIIYWNHIAESLYGWLAAEVVGKNIMDVNVSQTTKMQAAEIMARLQAGESWSGEFQVQRRDGTTFPALVTNAPILDEQGSLNGIIGVSSDITERVRSEETFKHTEQRYRALFEEAPAMYVITREAGDKALIADCNELFCRTLGYRREELLSKPLLDLYSPASRKASLEENGYQRIMNNESVNAERELVKRDGGIVPCMMQAVRERNADMQEASLRAMYIDITEQVRAKKEIEKTRGYLKNTLDGLGESIVLVDENGEILSTSRAWLEFAENNGAVMASVSVGADYFAPCKTKRGTWHEDAKPFGDGLNKILSGELKSFRFEYPCHSPDEQRWFTCNISMYDENNSRYFVFSHKEITQSKLTKEALIESERLLKNAEANAHLGYYQIDVQTGKAIWSEETFHILGIGMEAGELTAEVYKELIHPDDSERVFEIYDQCIEDGKTFDMIYRILRPNGELRHIHSIGEVESSLEGGIRMFGTLQDVSERIQAQEALLKGQERYKKAQAMGHVGNWEYDPVTTKFWGSDEAKRIYGFDLDAKDFTTENVENRIIERERVHQALLDLLEHDTEYDLVFDIIPDKGIRKTVHSIAEVERDVQGSPIKITGVISDITERQKAAEALRASEERYRTLIDQIPAIVYVDDFSSAPALTQYVSPYIETMLGFTPEEWVAGGFDLWKERLLPEDRDRVLAEYNRLIAHEDSSLNCEYRLLNKEGQDVWVLDRASVLHDPQGNPTLLHGVIHDITERKQAEISLKESQATFLAALSSMTDALFISDKDGQLIEFNDAFVSFHKFKARDECLRWLSEYPDVLDVYLDNGELAPLEMWAIPRALRGETVIEAEYTLHRKDINETWIGSYNFAPIRNGEEEIVGAVVVARDITERVKARKTILESEKRFSTIFQANPVAISLRNFTDGSCLDVNQTYLRLTGFSREQALKQSTLNMGIWSNPAEFENFQKILDRKKFLKNVEIRLLTKTGAGRDVLASFEKIKLNGKDCVLASFQDVAELKQSQQKLQTANQTLEKAQQVARLGSWTWNIQTNELQWSDEMYRIFGIEKEAFSGDLADVIGRAIHPDDRDKVEKSNLSVINDRVPIPVEYRVLRPDGSMSEVYAEAGELVLDKDGKPTILTGITQDITERKQVEQALRESHQQLRAISTYWQNAIEAERAHISREIHDEFGQSMTALKMDLNWLARRLPDEDDKLKRISGMGALVDESITLMRRIATDLRPNLLDDLGLNAALEWQVQEFTRRSEIPCKLKLPESELALDPSLITTIFRLVQETLTNVSRHAVATKVKVSLEQKKQELILIIQDNGRGINIDKLSNPRSLGLLSLRERAAQWGGETIIRGKPGIGTVVTVRIPLPDSTESAGGL